MTGKPAVRAAAARCGSRSNTTYDGLPGMSGFSSRFASSWLCGPNPQMTMGSSSTAWPMGDA
eukprot:362156-Chlamydomonas_euryale.AAC.9